MSTQIKRLYQNGNEFVPITLSEAVVVNTDNMKLLGVDGANLKITTLDKVLRAILEIEDENSDTLITLNSTVSAINTELAKKQNKLTAGAGINISDDGVISTIFELYKVVSSLPEPSKDVTNTIYIKRSSEAAGNIFSEYICVEPATGVFAWEEVGTIAADVDLSGYVTTDTFNTTISNINNRLDSTITASNATLSNGSTVVVDYNIPPDLYDSMVNIDTNDEIIAG